MSKDVKLIQLSPERLPHFITLLDRDVAIVIRPKVAGHEAGTVTVLVAA